MRAKPNGCCCWTLTIPSKIHNEAIACFVIRHSDFVILVMSVLVVGSIALDTVKTPVEEHSDLLGGSACYAALGASFFSPVRLVGIVGDDFPESEFEFWKSRKIDSEGVQRVNGKTFRWSGEYSWDLNTRETRSIALNVFEQFKPALPDSYRQTDFVLLANIAPSLQSHVLDQMERPRFVVADTMDLWIETTRSDLDDRPSHLERQRSAPDHEGNESHQSWAPDPEAGAAVCRDKKRRARRAAFWRRRSILQLRRLPARRHSRSDRGRGHIRRRHGWIPGGDGQEGALQ
jgi:hypothetical protein